jgi:pSer/pThr/pTyr-binding forkhead associated (FHA) protein
MASLRITQHPDMSPGQELPLDTDDYFVIVPDGVRPHLRRVQQGIPLDIDCFVIGRESDCHLAIPSWKVSKRHAQLRLQDRQWSIEDLRSRNGTWVNGQQIRSRTPLSHNDEIRVPDFRAVFENA